MTERAAGVPGVNLELKVPLADPGRAEALLSGMGATFAGVLHQRDTYRRLGSGRSKLREEEAGATLIDYERAEEGGERWSHYTLTSIPDPAALVAMWHAAREVRGVVEKQRRLWIYRSARIHIDAVTGLGDFLEIEVVDPQPPESGVRLLDELIDVLDLDTAQAIAGSYIDLIEARG